MHVIHARNVNDAYDKGLHYIRSFSSDPEPSRNGPVYRSPVPVTTAYYNPNERVLFDQNRDANPFFHFLEGLWMLGGRNDAKWVAEFASQMATYSDDSVTLNGAYGYRWRHYFQYDQLVAAINLLRDDFSNRRVVIGMWNPHRDLVDQTSKDLPCNLGIKFFGRRENGTPVLDMHVYNRSNDIIWGAYGANAVHMSMVHEYVATMVGVRLGVYYQISSDYHAYVSTYEKVTEKGMPEWKATDLYVRPALNMVPSALVQNARHFDLELEHFLSEDPDPIRYANQSLVDASWMRTAWRAHKAGDTNSAMNMIVGNVLAADWRLACLGWLARRIKTPTATEETSYAPARPKED